MKQISTAAAIMAVFIFIFSSVLSLPVTVLASKGGKLAPKPKTKAAKNSSAFSSLSYGGCGSYSYSMNCKQKPTSPSSFPPRSRAPSLSPSTSLTPSLSSQPTNACDLSPEERAAQIRELVSTVSNSSLFEDPSTPQAQALNWITNEDTIEPILCPNQIQFGEGCTMGGSVNPLVQRYIMVAFYFAAQGVHLASWKWLTPVNECEWGGVTCWNLCIDKLIINGQGNSLAGSLVAEIGSLDSLRHLSISGNRIKGTIPTTFGKLSRLQSLSLYHNQLTGSIPEELYGLTNLEELYLSFNFLAGTISPTIVDLKSLKEFILSYNELTGNIPDELYGLTNLERLSFSNNELTGTISTKIGDLQELRDLYLEGNRNKFSGTIPTEMGKLKKLGEARFYNNDITGTMPAEVCANRNNASPPGSLIVLTTSCEPQFTCDCCTNSHCSPGTVSVKKVMIHRHRDHIHS